VADTKKLIWGIVGIIFAIGVAYWGIKSLNNGMLILAIPFFIGAIIGAILGIKEIIQATKS